MRAQNPELPMVPGSPISDDSHRRRVRVYQMVTELHKIGYQGLRVWSQDHHDRIHLFPSIFATHSLAYGMVPQDFVALHNDWGLVATYYGKEMESKNAREAANIFVRQFPRIAKLSLLDDYEYAGWLLSLTGEMEEAGHVPYTTGESNLVSYAINADSDFPGEPQLVLGSRDNAEKTFPLPPRPKIGGDDLSRLVGVLLSYLSPAGIEDSGPQT